MANDELKQRFDAFVRDEQTTRDKEEVLQEAVLNLLTFISDEALDYLLSQLEEGT
jgi:hypothetical protein